MSLGALGSLLAALVVLLVGTLVNRRVALLSRYNIPDPITGGLLFAALAAIVSGADLRLLERGGKALLLFLLALFPYILVQDGTDAALAPQSHLIVPLAGAFFIDLMNAFVLTLLLALPFIGG